MASANHPPAEPPAVPQHFSPSQHSHYPAQATTSQQYPQQYPQQQSPPYAAQPFPEYPQQRLQPDQSPPSQHPYYQQYQHQEPQYLSRQDQEQQQPPPPPQHQHQQSRPPGPGETRKSRTFSFRSDKSQSQKSSDLHETSAEKEAKRLHSKADPTLAMQEAEPAAVAANSKSSLASLRNMRHKDSNGNQIDDPDWSNPTRSRWERPLDTIRSFEAAIDGGDRRSSTLIRPDVDNWNRRNTVYTTSANNNGGRYPYPRDSYYGSRPPSMMPTQFEGRYGPQEGPSEQPGPQGYNAYNMPPRQRYSRMASEPQFYTPRQSEQNFYPIATGNQRSYETVTSGSGSGTSGEPGGYQTDPTSSDNSSIDRVQAPKRQPEPVNDYGIGFSQNQATAYTLGFNGPKNSSEAAYRNGHQAPQHPGGMNQQEPAPPAVPRKENSILRKPTRTPLVQTTALAPAGGDVSQRPAPPEKRKSWLSRRFSKN